MDTLEQIKKIGANLYFLPSEYISYGSYISNQKHLEVINATLMNFLENDDFKIRNLTFVEGGVYITVE